MERNRQSFGFLDLDQLEPNPFFLCDFGIQKRNEESYYYHNLNRGNYEGFVFQYTLHGCGIYEEEGLKYQLTEQSAFLTPVPYNSCYYFSDEYDRDWEFFYLHFQGTAAKTLYEKIHKLYGNCFFLDRHSTSVQLFMKEYEEVQAGKLYGRYEGSLFLYTFLISLLKDLETPYQAQKNQYVEQALFFLKRDFSTEVSLNQLAEQLGISTEHLSRLFKEQTGFTLMAYLTNLRMDKAIYLLRNSEESIVNIGKACGYASGNYFSKVFLKMMGVTPSVYRQM